jgi:hypothetical protein
LSDDRLFEHVLYLVASARDCLDEPVLYAPQRMLEAISRLVESFPDEAFLREAKVEIDRNKAGFIDDPSAYKRWLDELLRHFAAEAKRRALASAP